MTITLIVIVLIGAYLYVKIKTSTAGHFWKLVANDTEFAFEWFEADPNVWVYIKKDCIADTEEFVTALKKAGFDGPYFIYKNNDLFKIYGHRKSMERSEREFIQNYYSKGILKQGEERETWKISKG